MKQLKLTALAAAFALAACQQAATPTDNVAVTADEQAAADDVAPNGNEQVAIETGASAAPVANEAAPAATSIPAAFRGRWGMVPADCTSTRGDAKGLILIDADSIKFYESRALLGKVTGDYPENFTATFAFTGEGQEWTKTENLKLTGSSNTLIRSETDPAASFTYKRCA